MPFVRFDTTHWSLVIAAGSEDSSAARSALDTLCERYWYPIYAYIRRRGIDAEDARDLTQGFLLSLVDRRSFADLDAERGRFRAFLLASVTHFLANNAERQRAQKRGGGLHTVSLDWNEAEGRYRHEPVLPATPETIFERRWALTVIDRVLADLRLEWAADGRADEFDGLKACLLGTGPEGGYRSAGALLGMTEGAVKVAVHRLRRRFQRRLRSLITETVADPADVDDEIRHLIRSL